MSQIKCPQCGESMDTLDGYCMHCGYTIEEEPVKPAFAASSANSGADGGADEEESSRSPVIGRDNVYIHEKSSSGGINGMVFNIAYLAFAAICVILIFVPFAVLTDKNNTKYTIMNSNWGVGITIIAVAVLGFIFSFVKRKRLVILLTGLGLAGYGLYSFYAISRLSQVLEKYIKVMQSLEDISAMLGGDKVKITYTITPVYYIFAVCAIIAGGLAAITFITTTDDM
ncbi:MAG: hypothetical protein IKW88_04265 [Clostridiales bacterium]|nr:hypothetical protein [Clostridiales bacterium]